MVDERQAEPTEADASETSEQVGARSPHLWVSSTYFAEGFPYAVVHNLAEVMFKEMGASLQAIGLTSLFHLPWNLKFLWGPWLDAFSTKRRWMIAIEVAIAICIVALAVCVQGPAPLAVASVLFVILAVFSATHDIAIDGYYMEGLDQDGQSKFVGYRATAYKIAMMTVAGPLLWLAGKVGWTVGYLATAVIMGVLLAYHWMFLPKVETARQPFMALVRSALKLKTAIGAIVLAALIYAGRAIFTSETYGRFWDGVTDSAPFLKKISTSGWIALLLLAVLVAGLLFLPKIQAAISKRDSFYARAFVNFLEQDQVSRILAFVILFRAGESFLLKMRYPFLRDMGMTLEQYAFASGTVGLIASFSATLLGGWLISKDGLRKWIWPFVIAQNVLNLLYLGVAVVGGPINLTGVTVIIAIEAAGAGLGTAVFMVYLMRCCRPEFKAAHMATLTALMSVSFTLAGVASGFLADFIGFTNYFAFTFLATIPGMALIPFIPHLDAAPKES